MCQNRRNDVFFCPEAGDFNVRQFFNLVQMDGYNPLEIRPNTFVIEGEKLEQAKAILAQFLGKGGFLAEDGRVMLKLSPVLAGRMFDENGDAAFNFCGNCPVTYHNPSRKNTYGTGGAVVKRMVAHLAGGDVEVMGDIFGEEAALDAWAGQVNSVEVWMEHDRAIGYSGCCHFQSHRAKVSHSLDRK